MRLLVEDGNADVDCRDRWDNTPLDEARRVSAKSVIAFLENCDREAGVSYCHLDARESMRPDCYYDPWSQNESSEPPQRQQQQQRQHHNVP